MAWYDRFLSGRQQEVDDLRARVTELTEMRSIDSLPWNTGADLRSSAPTPTPTVALRLAPVYAAVSLIARSVSTLPIHAYRKTGDDRVRMPFLPQLFQSPSIHGDITDWLHRLLTSLLLDGNAYGLITSRDGREYPTTIEWLNPQQVYVVDQGQWGRGSYWDPIYYWRGREVPRENLVHIPWFSIPFHVRGMTPMGAYASSVAIGLSGQDFVKDWYDGGGQAVGTFKNTTQKITPPEAAEIKSRLVASIRSHQPLVHGADWEYKPITINPKDSIFVETHQMSATDIAAVYGIYPPERIGGVTKSNMTYCVDTETEMLTRRGWLRYDEVRIGDIGLTLNVETGLSEWQPVTEVSIFEGPHPGVRMRHGSHSSLTTPDHRWPVRREYIDAAGRQRPSETLEWTTSQAMLSSDRIVAAAPGCCPSTKTHSDALVELVAWFYTEGWIGPSGETRIAQSHDVNEAKCARIRHALCGLFGESRVAFNRAKESVWVEYRRDSGVTQFRLNRAASLDLLRLAPEKVPSMDFLTSLTTDQLRLFIDVSIEADGSTTKHGTRVMAQKDARRTEALQIACLLAGISGNIRRHKSTGWSLALQATVNRKPKGHSEYVSEEFIAGPVWCPTTPNGTWFARREGTIYATGNTNVEQEQIQFVQLTLLPYVRKLESVFFDLLPQPQFVHFNLDSLIRSDTHTRWLVHQIRREIGATNIDEIRDIEDMPHLPNGMGEDYNPLVAVRELIRSAAASPLNPNQPGFVAGEPGVAPGVGMPVAGAPTAGPPAADASPALPAVVSSVDRFTAQPGELSSANDTEGGNGS